MPGPDILFVFAQSLQRGARAAMVVGLGLCSGLVFHTAAVAAGVAVILQGSPALFRAVKYAGAAYLLWLAVKNLLQVRRNAEEVPPCSPKLATRPRWL